MNWYDDRCSYIEHMNNIWTESQLSLVLSKKLLSSGGLHENGKFELFLLERLERKLIKLMLFSRMLWLRILRLSNRAIESGTIYIADGYLAIYPSTVSLGFYFLLKLSETLFAGFFSLDLEYYISIIGYYFLRVETNIWSLGGWRF
jgi:hypothetical protein